MKKEESLGMSLFALFVGVPVGILTAPIRAWCAIKIYDWHARPYFGGPSFTVYHVWGMFLLFSLISWNVTDTPDVERTLAQNVGRVFALAAAPFITLLIAWVLR